MNCAEPWAFPVGGLVLHKKSDRVYIVLAHARLEGYDADAYVYAARDEPLAWVRSKKDFEDGRFVLLAVPVTKEAPRGKKRTTRTR